MALTKRTFIAAIAMLAAGSAIAADTGPLEAVDVATVQPAGPRSGGAGKAFFNIQGSAGGNFASYAVARFDIGPALAGATINAASLSLTQSNAFFTANGEFAVYYSDQDTTDIQPGAGIAYTPAGNTPFQNDFTDAASGFLGSFSFQEVANGTVDLLDLTLTGNAGLLADADGIVTLILAEFNAPGVAATYAGNTNTDFAGPTLTLEFTPVPVPAAAWLMGSSLFGLGAMRRRSC